MTRYFGVKCKACGYTLALVECPDPEAHFIPPLDPIACPDCGGSYIYVSDEVFVFDTESPVFGGVGR